MRIKRLVAENFGCMKNWKSPSLDGDILIFAGPNESGKSTIFNLVSSLLYGFSPASKENNKYSPWDGTNASCSGEIVYDDGTDILVNRVLKSKAEGILTCRNNSTSIGNNPLMKLDMLPRNIFMEAYALTVDELCFPDDKLWQKIQDQLLGGQYKSFLKPVRDVVSGLEGEASSLWRSDRRGTPADKQLKSNLTGLKERLKSASENGKRLYDLQEELSRLNIALNEKLSEKAHFTAYIERFQRLSPVRKKLMAIDEMKMKCRWISNFKSIPDNAGKILDEINKKIDDIKTSREKLYVQRKKYIDQASLYTQKDRKVYENDELIKDAVRSYSQVSMDLQSEGDVDEEIKNTRGRISERAGDFIKGGWKDEYEDAIYSIDEAGLKVYIDKFSRLKSDCEEQKTRIEGLKSKPANKMPLVLIAVSVLLMASGFVGKGLLTIPSIAAGVLLIFYSIVMIKSSKNSSELREAYRCLKEIEGKKNDTCEAVRKCMGMLPVSDVIMENPDEMLIINLNRLKDTIKMLKDALDRKDKIDKRLRGRMKIVSQLMINLNEVPGDNILKNINCLEGLLNAAIENRNIYIDSCRKLEEIKASVSENNEEEEKVINEKNKLVGEITKIDGITIDDKIKNLDEMRKVYQNASLLETELKREYPDLSNIVEEINKAEEKNESWTNNDEEMAAALTKKEQIEVELNDINEKIGSAKKGLEQNEGFERLDDLKGEIMEVEEEIKEERVKRDRLQLLKNILIEADNQYREENQPDILKKAGRYLNIITDGRYISLMMDESEKNLFVREGNGDTCGLERALSRGTKEQIYLSLRLALVDHLDVNGEHIPIFLDEAFVNWDAHRCDNLINILENIANMRQVFMFTCHDSFAEKFKSLSNAHIINLGINRG